MTRYQLRLIEEQVERLAKLLFRDTNEAVAIALCGRSVVQNPWESCLDERFIVHELIEIDKSAYFSRSPTGFTWSTTPFFQALKRAEARDLAVAVFHSHPHGCMAFSELDDIAEKELFEIAFNRLDSRSPHLSVIMDSSNSISARAYGPDLKAYAISQVAVLGERWSFGGHGGNVKIGSEFDRQVRAFGSAANEKLGQLRIGVVGCGGTGSAVVSLLARIGVRQLALIDADRVDETNLNRLHFATRPDATLRRRKVDVLAEGAATIGLPMSIVRVPYYADHAVALKVLRACDVVFGCTDDHLGREILNRVAHFYFIPVIDMGLLIEPNDNGGYDTFDGRVTVIQPGYTCQSCRKLIDSEQLHIEALRRDPELLEERRRAGYVPDDPDPSPAVVTFTTEVSAMAVNELFHRINGFRGAEQRCSEHVRQFQYLKGADTLPAGRAIPGCKLCDRRLYDGRGDMSPLLDISL